MLKRFYCILFLGILYIKGLVLAQGPGDLMVSPPRVVFEGNRVREEVYLINRGTDTAVYGLSFVNYRMTPNGDFEQITKPDSGQYFARDHVRFFPRRVELPPNEVQVIRMQVRRSSDMKNREYRSHLYFRATNRQKPRNEETQEQEESQGISIQLRPIYGISIPVILRLGDLNASVTINDISLNMEKDSLPELNFTVNRNGNRSVYGNITVLYKTDGKNPVKLRSIKGVAVYTPNQLRHFTMKLPKREDIKYNKGSLVIKYESQQNTGQKIYAQQTLPLD